MIIDREDIAVSRIIAHAGTTNIRLLEIGCGDGRITRGLHASHERLVAIDPDEAAITRAREQSPTIDFRVGSGESLDCLEEHFDVIVFSLSLHHQNGAKALRQVETALRPGGKVLVLEPTISSQISQLGFLFENESAALEEAVEQIHDSNFDIVLREEITTTWLFENIEELHDWIFDYYQQPRSHEKLHRIGEFLGEKIHDRPIILSDTLTLFELSR